MLSEPDEAIDVPGDFAELRNYIVSKKVVLPPKSRQVKKISNVPKAQSYSVKTGPTTVTDGGT